MGLFGIVLIIILIVLFFIFPKQMLYIGLGVVGLIIALWLVYIEAPERQKDALNKRVDVSVMHSLYSCNHDFPLLVTIINNSSKTITKVEWNISIYIPGHSTDISGFDHSYFSSDKILKPGVVLKSCYRLPPKMKGNNQDLGSLRYVISSKYVYFKD